MVKTRVHDLAAEFGIRSDELISLLKEMDIFVRSHLSALEATQVALVRARWEREKRKASAPATSTRRRRTKKVAEEPAPEPKTRRRRRTAAEMAEIEARKQKEAEDAERKAAEKLTLEPTVKPKEEVASLRDRAARLFRDTEPGDVEHAAGVGIEPETPVSTEGESPAGVAEAEAEPADVEELAVAEGAPAGEGASPTRRAPGVRPTPVRPTPVASAAPGRAQSPRPVASAAPGTTPDERRRERDKGGKRRKKGRRSNVDQEAVAQNISKTLASFRAPARKSRRGRDEPTHREIQEQERREEKEREKTLVRVTEFITVSELANVLKVPPTEIVTFAFKELGHMVTVNQRLDFDMIELIASSFGFEATRDEEYATAQPEATKEDAPEDLMPRPPVVTVMGHVDHGKTSLLDRIRSANVIAGESGGITQHIGAYHVKLPDERSLTFLDTPGHEAFTAMRARGAQVTDVVVLVVAADDSVMPQTIEAISHAKNAGVPLVVAINKIDLPGANVARVQQELLSHEVVLEEFGGQVLSSPVSAKTGEGLDALLDQVMLQGEILDLKANPNRPASGSVVEGILDPGKGPVATVLVENGTLRAGDAFVCGQYSGRVRAMLNERGDPVEDAGPSIPVQVLGFEGVPQAGDSFQVVADANEARDIAQRRQRLEREAQHRRSGRVQTLEEFMTERRDGEAASLRLIIKADQGGPAEALADALSQLTTAEVQVDVVHRGVGAINESDVLLAKASEAIIIGFHVRPDSNARTAAERESVEIRTYRVIYEAVDDVKAAMEGLLRPEQREVVLGEAEVKDTFKISGIGTVAGCYVRQGIITRSAKVRVVRDGVVVYEGVLASLKRFKDDVKEVRDGLECGMGVENFNDVKVGDLIEAYTVEEVARTLETGTGGPGAG